MTVFQAFIYGIIQGAAEFLPISSSAHLVVLPRLFNWPEAGLAFDVSLHLGTLIAVIWFFWKDWIRLVTAGVREPKSQNGRLFWFLVIATIPGAVIAKAFEEHAEKAFRNSALIGIMMIIMGAILYWVDKNAKKDIKLEKIGFGRSLGIGFSQALAIIPGVSRSGITMTTGLFLGLTREAVARFSFLLSTPIILGAGLLKIKDLFKEQIGLMPFVVGIATSAIVGFISIKFLLDYLKNKGFGVFAIYRFVVGILFIFVYFIRGV